MEDTGYLTNETIFNLTERPNSMLVIGGGPIGTEMAQSFQRFGTQVSLIELADHILSREDIDAANIVQRSLLKDGVNLILSANEIIKVEPSNGQKTISYHCGKTDKPCHVTSDEILVGVGRAPNVYGLGLEQAGINFHERRGVEVDDTLRTTNPRVFAAGDICSKYKFTHAADFLARIVIANALLGQKQKASKLIVPWYTYSDPQLAHVGLNEQEADRQRIAIDTFKQSMNDVDRAMLDGDTDGFVKVHVKKGTDQILGATIVAMKNGIGLGGVGSVIHLYPTQAEAIRKTGDLYNRTRLACISHTFS